MPRSFYELQLICLVSFCLVSLLVERHLSKRRANPKAELEEEDGHHVTSTAATSGSGHVLSTLTRQYLIVYAIVMGADWLQGPYIYSLYKEQYAFPERLVAAFFVTGFMSAGLMAPVVGVLADQHGRRKICLVFCVTYAFSCVCILFPYLPVLFAGRLLGGFSTSILYSAFESWLISASTSLALPQTDLSGILGRASLVNGFVAAAAGVASNELVGMTGSFATPFVASGVLLVLGWIVIKGTWTENYGSGGGTDAATSDPLQLRRLGQAWKIVRSEPPLLVIGLTQTCFEGSMYLFVFNWVPAMQEVALPYNPLPLGYIFSSFMVAMMVGSLLYTSIVSLHSTTDPEMHGDSSLVLHAKLSSLVCAVGALALAASIKSKDEHVRFWAFCIFEACVGMYYPVQGMLRGTLISNEHRATLSSLFRVPLNVFVVVSLLTGVSSARYIVLMASSIMLSLSSMITAAFLVDHSDSTSLTAPRPPE
ncbi:DUF791-domain-containing protein [Laetiporus sulphureus 93-53]|uniref:Molybdate-anion transporter n=1 Tax=Laetiporus sulphureus 93-53 TaxID=1314785 RepID=A0A165EGP8_9APHY|nr:DUF791-domain-containing protein [Laetiporus sulphureus 93-53]KZT07017.1 DUF791-domain-containing protein [Laetiporus sulphureus 93-53]